jgi:hypothetical protein
MALPSSLRSAFRIKDVMAECAPLDPAEPGRAASAYVRSLGITAATPLPPGVLYRHRALNYWAGKHGKFPALIGYAEDGPNRALLAVFLSVYGKLAPVREPQLLLGAPNGACLRLACCNDERRHLWLTQSLDDALRLFAAHPEDGVYCAMSFANLGKVRVPRDCERVSIVINNGSAGARDDLRAAIAMQDVEARVLNSDEAVGKVGA